MSDLLAISRKVIQQHDTHEIEALSQQFYQQIKTLRKSGALLNTALNELNPAQHTLAFAHFLDAEIANTNTKQLNPQQASLLIQHCHHFFSNFHAWQINIARAWSMIWTIAREFCHIAMSQRRDSAPLSSLRRTCQVLDSVFPHALTSVHTHFVVLSVRAKHYRAASSIVERPIYSILPRSGVDPIELLNYFYFAGLIHAANKQWHQAYDAFYMCLSVPGNAVSAIQIAAHKKLVLTSIISHNELPDFTQRTHSTNLMRSLEQANQTYLDLVKSFDKQLSTQPSSSNTRQQSSSTQAFHTSLLTHTTSLTDTLNNDRCYGLALELDKHLFETRIQRLTRTYITLELSEMAKLVGASSVTDLEATVNRLINSGIIGARINQMTGLCEFVDQQDTSDVQTQRLQDQITELCTVLEALQNKQRAIERNPLYIAKQLMSNQGEERASSNRARHGANNEDWELNSAIAESLRTS